MRASWPQVSGHISTAEGAKVFALGGKWNEYLDAQRCDEEGNPLPDAETLHLWKVHACLVLAAFAALESIWFSRKTCQALAPQCTASYGVTNMRPEAFTIGCMHDLHAGRAKARGRQVWLHPLCAQAEQL